RGGGASRRWRSGLVSSDARVPGHTSPKRQRGGGASRRWRSGLVSETPLDPHCSSQKTRKATKERKEEVFLFSLLWLFVFFVAIAFCRCGLSRFACSRSAWTAPHSRSDAHARVSGRAVRRFPSASWVPRRPARSASAKPLPRAYPSFPA